MPLFFHNSFQDSQRADKFLDKNLPFKTATAFTLIEMIVVLTVVMIIGILAVSAYAGTRRQASLDIAVDALVSALRDQSGKAKSGQLLTFSGSPDLKAACFGVVLDTQAAQPFGIQAFPYFAIAPNKLADVCDPSTPQVFPSSTFDNLVIKSILANDNQKYERLSIFYKPPFGRMVLFQQAGEVPNIEKLKVVLGLKNVTQESDKRCIEINTQSGVITRLDQASC